MSFIEQLAVSSTKLQASRVIVDAFEKNHFDSFQACNTMRRRWPYSGLCWRPHSQQAACKTHQQVNSWMVEKALRFFKCVDYNICSLFEGLFFSRQIIWH